MSAFNMRKAAHVLRVQVLTLSSPSLSFPLDAGQAAASLLGESPAGASQGWRNHNSVRKWLSSALTLPWPRLTEWRWGSAPARQPTSTYTSPWALEGKAGPASLTQDLAERAA